MSAAAVETHELTDLFDVVLPAWRQGHDSYAIARSLRVSESAIKTVGELQAGGWLTVERVKVPGRTGAQFHVSNHYSFAFDRVAGDEGGSPKSAPPPSADIGPPPSPKSAPPPSEIRTRGSPKSAPELGKLEQGKKKKNLSPIEPTDFDRWYEAYPRKVGKDAARPVFERVVKSGKASVAELIAGAERYAADRAGEDPQFTKYPKTWLNGGHWADEPTTRSTGRGSRRVEKSGVTDLLREIEERIHERDNPDPFGGRRADAGAWPADRSLDGRDRDVGAGPILDLEPICRDDG